MQRLCILMPDVESAHRVVDDLRKRGVVDQNIYVVAKEGTPLGDLPEAGDIAQSDFYPQLERGLATGAVIGAIGGLIAMRVAGAVFGGAAILLFGLIGAGLNGLLSAIAGSSFPNSRLREFESAIQSGKVLIMVDVTNDQKAPIEQELERSHPELEIECVEPAVPIIPKR
jgi:hypothetical protein